MFCYLDVMYSFIHLFTYWSLFLPPLSSANYRSHWWQWRCSPSVSSSLHSWCCWLGLLPSWPQSAARRPLSNHSASGEGGCPLIHTTFSLSASTSTLFYFFFILITSHVIAIHACQYWYWLLYRIWLSLSLLFLLRYYVWRCTKLRWLNTLNKIYANQKSVGMIWKWQPFQREETRLCECAQGTAVSACVDSTAPLIVITTKTVCAPAPVHGAFSSCSEKLGIHY